MYKTVELNSFITLYVTVETRLRQRGVRGIAPPPRQTTPPHLNGYLYTT
jgi:hypothetical protein